MEVVDGKQERRLRAQIHGQPVERVERGKGRFAGGLVVALTREVEDACRRCCGARKAALTFHGVGETGLEQLAHNAEGVLALELAAARRQDDQPTRGRTPAPIGDKAGLADPRRTLNEDEPRLAGQRVRDGTVELVQFALALEQAGRPVVGPCPLHSTHGSIVGPTLGGVQ